MEAQRKAEKQAEFDAIPVDAAVERWFPFVGYGVDAKLKEAAFGKIMAKPGHVAELGALMTDPQPEKASEVMLLLFSLPRVSADYHPFVTKAGQQIIEKIEKVNKTSAAEDPSYEGAAECSIRFHGWMEAVRCLREKTGGDFTPELAQILKLSRIRTDSFVMQQDIRRVASYYMKEWAGVEPLPGDPPPK